MYWLNLRHLSSTSTSTREADPVQLLSHWCFFDSFSMRFPQPKRQTDTVPGLYFYRALCAQFSVSVYKLFSACNRIGFPFRRMESLTSWDSTQVRGETADRSWATSAFRCRRLCETSAGLTRKPGCRSL